MKKFYLGTWQFSDQFKKIDLENKVLMLEKAYENKCYFDTAPVYASGAVEVFLGQYLSSDANILTKVPAVKKPDIQFDYFEKCYPGNSVFSSLESSLIRLRRNKVYCLLLHNWSREWVGVNIPIQELQEIKKKGKGEKIGISLPDGFNERLSSEICSIIDIIEVPYNHIDYWILNDIQYYKKFDIEIIVRSIFCQGLRIKNYHERESLQSNDIRLSRLNAVPFEENMTAEIIIQNVKELNVSVVIGSTNINQISQNLLNFKPK